MNKRTHRLRLAGCLLILTGCVGQDADAEVQTVAINAVEMLGDLAFLAHDSLEGRLVGSDGNRIAREYIAERFARLQLATFGDSYLRPIAGDVFSDCEPDK